MESAMDDEKLVDNEFCKAILHIIEMTSTMTFLDDPPSMEKVRVEFSLNGYDCDVDFKQPVASITKRKPFAKVNSLKKVQKQEKVQRYGHCRFCENNQEPAHVYNNHNLRDNLGRLTCPRLRKYVCPICGAKGDNAHTVRYCNKKPIYVMKEGRCDLAKSRSVYLQHNKAIRI
jgi:hypothetical protein